jgi:hypothetical protein
MTEKTRTFEQTETECLDIDADGTNDFVAITKDHQILTPTFQTSIKLNITYPLIRRLDKTQTLLVDCRTKKNKPNAWIIDENGIIQTTFMAGDGVEDVVVLNNKIIISYFDEGVFSGIGSSDQGVVVFDFEGNILFGYRDKYGHQVDIADCYCLSAKTHNTVLFLMYPGFPLVELSLDGYEHTVRNIPEKLYGASSVTNMGDEVFFHAPYADNRTIFKWTIGGNKIEKIGEYSGRLRGLQRARFLSKCETGYTIIDLIN